MYLIGMVGKALQNGTSQKTRDKFKELDLSQKAATIALTILTSPFLIVWGIVTFGAMVKYFSVKNMSKNLNDQQEETASKATDVANSALPNTRSEEQTKNEQLEAEDHFIVLWVNREESRIHFLNYMFTHLMGFLVFDDTIKNEVLARNNDKMKIEEFNANKERIFNLVAENGAIIQLDLKKMNAYEQILKENNLRILSRTPLERGMVELDIEKI